MSNSYVHSREGFPIDKPENFSPHTKVSEYRHPKTGWPLPPCPPNPAERECLLANNQTVTSDYLPPREAAQREHPMGIPASVTTGEKKRAVRESIPAMLPGSNIEQIDYSKFDVPGEPRTTLPTDPAARKNIPITTGVLDYFPAAIAEVAYVSYVGNEKHNPGEDLHHARGKSMDHADCIARHLTERGTIDTVRLPDGREFKVRHSAYVAWRALALLQEELEADGAPLARGAR